MTLRRLTGRRRATRGALLAPIALVAAGLLSTGAAGPTSANASAHQTSVADCTSAASNARARGGSDGSDPNDLTLRQTVRFHKQLKARLQGVRSATLAKYDSGRQHIIVRVAVHVITRNNGTGGVTHQQIKDQLRVLNDGYAGRTSQYAADTAFRFRLASVDRTRNTDWFNWSDPDVDPADDAEAKAALHQGNLRILNVYIANLQDGLLGYSQFPFATTVEQDGLVLLNESLPGGSAAPYNLGDTATHEVGHWLGLFHTFENGCHYPGDFVKDTPYQFDGDNIFECDASLNTCAAPGRDPIHNFMSYGDDPCLSRFTPGQARLALSTWLSYRQ